MGSLNSIDFEQAHRFFATDCFNRAWGLIEKTDRSDDETQQMLLLALASLWHWQQRDDRTPRHLSISYWQVSRACALAGLADSAWRFGEWSLEAALNESAFYRGYAHEALARAAALSGEAERVAYHLDEARELLGQVADPEEIALLQADLATVRI